MSCIDLKRLIESAAQARPTCSWDGMRAWTALAFFECVGRRSRAVLAADSSSGTLQLPLAWSSMCVSAMAITGFAGPVCFDRAAVAVGVRSPLKGSSPVGRRNPSKRPRYAPSMVSRPAPSPVHKLLILGGTGRVGSKAAEYLARQSKEPLEITLAGRNVARGRRICETLAAMKKPRDDVTFAVARVDVANANELAAAIRGCDTVLHTAGPFQRRDNPGEVLSAALSIGRNYVDVCDDTEVCFFAVGRTCTCSRSRDVLRATVPPSP